MRLSSETQKDTNTILISNYIYYLLLYYSKLIVSDFYLLYTKVFEMPDANSHAKYLTIKRTKGLNLNNNNSNNDENNNNNNEIPEIQPASPRVGPAHVDSPFIGAPKRDFPKKETDIPQIDLESKLFSEKFMRQTLRLPPALGEAFRIMEKNLYIPPATLQNAEYPLFSFYLFSHDYIL